MTIIFISSATKYWLRRKVAGLLPQTGDEATETFNTSQTNIWLRAKGALLSSGRLAGMQGGVVSSSRAARRIRGPKPLNPQPLSIG
jgi:hypothetical protein